MEYTVNKLAKLSGVSTRTLRYYDQIGLLHPLRISSNGYRIYGQNEIDRLQQILFYRELEFPLDEISRILSAPDYDTKKALNEHLSALKARRNQIDLLIGNVTKTISSLKGEIVMNNDEKFEGFKQNAIKENEKQYGKEIRGKYGDDAVDASNAKFSALSREQYNRCEELRTGYEQLLKDAFEIGDPACDKAQQACELHKQWLCCYWKDGTYSKQAHRLMAEMYVSDERFREYYDKLALGCAYFFRDAINIFCQ